MSGKFYPEMRASGIEFVRNECWEELGRNNCSEGKCVS